MNDALRILILSVLIFGSLGFIYLLLFAIFAKEIVCCFLLFMKYVARKISKKKNKQVIYPNNFEAKIRFDKLREVVKKHCLSSLGRDLVDEISFSDSYNEIKIWVNQVAEFKQICEDEDNFPLGYFIDVRQSLSNIKVQGAYLELEELFNLKRSLDTVAGIIRFFKGQEEGMYPYLRELTRYVNIYPDVTRRIDSILTKNGKMKDNASPELKNIRSSLIQKQSTISKRMHGLLREAKKDGWVDSDVNISIRDGRMVIPVTSAYKRKVVGIVHDESATGKTSYIEPAEIVETNNEIRELEYAERREMMRILREFSDSIRPFIRELLYTYDFLAQIDYIRAKALFARHVHALLPDIEDKPMSLWEEAVHPLLYISLRGEGRDVVPLDIELNEEQRIILISGPNAGGKSVCLQTVGLIQYMFQCGFLVPMGEKSKMGIFSRIFIDIGDEQSMENDLSTYSSHLMNMKHFVKNANSRTLMLIDEFGTGTEPMLGGAIAESILNKLNQKRVSGVITTHYTNLKHFASETDGIENGAMMYDTQLLMPLFKLNVGKPGSSFAFEIARKIGLPEDILKDATDKIGADHINFDKHLRDIVRDKRYWEAKRNKIRQNEKKLDELVEKYEGDLKDASKLRKEIIEKAKVEAKNLLADANKSIEKTIRVIKETNANKEKTRLVRKEFEETKEFIINTDAGEVEQINRKIQQIKDRAERKKNKSQDKPAVSKLKLPKAKKQEFDPSTLAKGDHVRLDNQKTTGEIMEINKNNASVAFGSLLTNVKISRLTKVSKTQAKKETRGMNQTTAMVQERISKSKLSFRADLDVRGLRGEEAVQTVIDHLDEVIMLEISEFRILHGTGHGILRQMIREYLNTVGLVRSCKDEKIQQGGSGITVVDMDY